MFQKYPKKCLLFQEELQSKQRIGASPSEIRDMINLKQSENVITNKEVKLVLVEFLSDQIQFCKPCQAN